jgi:UDP-2,4-diacetamido-2,4,6-trideoxy-beta-L-altropyranose hydrolase
MSSALFRTDGGEGIGDGHLMRCLALACALRDRNWKCELLTADPRASGVLIWREAGFEPLILKGSAGGTDDADQVIEIVRRTNQQSGPYSPPWLVLDGYHFGDDMRSRLRSQMPVLIFDDTGNNVSPSSIIVNQNAGAEELLRKYAHRAELTLLGPRFVALRPSIMNETYMGGKGILITFGSAAPPNLSLQVLFELQNRGCELPVIVVGTPPQQSFKNDLRRLNFRWVEPTDLAPLLSKADVAVIGGGVTALEAAYFGLPAVVLVLADNQIPGATALHRAGTCLIASGNGDAAVKALQLASDDKIRKEISSAGRRLVDGKGPSRIASAMEEISGCSTASRMERFQ